MAASGRPPRPISDAVERMLDGDMDTPGGVPMGRFGPSKDEAWKRLAEEIDADFIGGGFWKGSSKVEARSGPWTVTLDTYTVHTGHAHFTYTRMRAPTSTPTGCGSPSTARGFFVECEGGAGGGALIQLQVFAISPPRARRPRRFSRHRSHVTFPSAP